MAAAFLCPMTSGCHSPGAASRRRGAASRRGSSMRFTALLDPFVDGGSAASKLG